MTDQPPDNRPKLQVKSPDVPGAEQAASLIVSILQRKQIDLSLAQFDDIFFFVLNDFIRQAREAGFPDDDNPFVQIEREIQGIYQQQQEAELANVPEPFRADWARFDHMQHEAHHDPGLLIPAVRILESIRDRVDPAEHPEFWGDLHNELGNTYIDLPVADRERAVRQALAAFQVALDARPVDHYPYQHAGALHNLGGALLNSPIGDRATTLRQALAAFDGVARFITKDQTPTDYGVLMFNLATTLSLLPDGDIPAQQARAAHAFAEAESVFGTDYPSGWAVVQVRRAQGHHWGPSPDYPAAIAAYDAALTVYTLDAFRWEHIAATVQKALAILTLKPNAGGRATATMLLEPLQAPLAEPRTSQQHAQLMMAFGPPFNGQPRQRRLAALTDAVSAAADQPIPRAVAALQLICADPVNAADHLNTALTALAFSR